MSVLTLINSLNHTRLAGIDSASRLTSRHQSQVSMLIFLQCSESVQSGRWSGRSLSKLEMSSCCSPTEFYNVMSLSSLRIILKELRTERTSGPQRCVRSWARFYQAWVQRNTNTPEENILLDSGSPLNSQRIIYHYWFHAESIWQPLHVVHCYIGQTS